MKTTVPFSPAVGVGAVIHCLESATAWRCVAFKRTSLPDKRFKGSVDSVVVEGYSDESGFRGMDKEKSESENLKLSQQRSMQVVASALEDLHDYPDERSCFLTKLSASGRGQQDQLDNPENSRRVVFKIRVKARDIDRVVKEIK